MLSSLSINEFAAKLSSGDVPPGGGSAAAMYGLMATGLLEMSINHSLKSLQLAEHHELLIAKQADLARLHIELTILIDRDALALRGLLAAAGLPELTPEAKQSRDVALQKALKQAAEVPLETARACLEVIEIGKAVVGRVDKLVVSDLMTGAAAAHAGIIGGLLSAAINLSEIHDDALVSALKGQIYLLRTTADELRGVLEERVYSCEPFSVLRV
ncbi:cyclodeaminase/cyclohydrolase family protein [Sporomusa sp.]|uniref:cyclodeaminase/cyclohydrolase family protein n=1 Tax=Sporomusa sp. TaxID=2078658 RepID=UPI002CFEA56B|nr:cyclodeaminase/cyclohydrolase family protein [Sporomusa sp.]HWR41651.1 cyclodeaminase/cyclohydrolase family protein [Sporomusa sp.]